MAVRRAVSLWLGALIWSAQPWLVWGAEKRAGPPEPRPAPLVELGGFIHLSLDGPGPPYLGRPGDPLALGPGLPPVLSPTKANILYERARTLAPKLPAPEIAPIPSRFPGVLPKTDPPALPELLYAVNSVLKDISPERLSSMPVEELHGLASAILTQIPQAQREGETRDSAGGIATVSRARAERILYQRSWLLRKEPLGDDKISVQGVPKHVKLLRPADHDSAKKDHPLSDPKAVFRHYAKNDWDAMIIAESGLLEASPLPYMKIKGFSHSEKAYIYGPLTGVFLTLPDIPPEAVGVPGRQAYVDLRLPRGLPLLEIEPKRIYLAPLPAPLDRTAWYQYQEGLKKGDLSRLRLLADEERMRLLNPDGVPGPFLSVPIEVVGGGRLKTRH